MEEAFGRGEVGGVGGFVPSEIAWVVLAPGVEGEDGGGEVDAADFGGVEIGERGVLFGAPEAEAQAGGGAAGAAGALGGGGAADARQFQAVEAAAGVVGGLAGVAGVNHGRHAIDGKRGFGDVGGADYFALGGGTQDAGLVLGGKRAVEGEEEQVVALGEELEVVDRSAAGGAR